MASRRSAAARALTRLGHVTADCWCRLLYTVLSAWSVALGGSTVWAKNTGDEVMHVNTMEYDHFRLFISGPLLGEFRRAEFGSDPREQTISVVRKKSGVKSSMKKGYRKKTKLGCQAMHFLMTGVTSLSFLPLCIFHSFVTCMYVSCLTLTWSDQLPKQGTAGQSGEIFFQPSY